jgi:hypothetical protein
MGYESWSHDGKYVYFESTSVRDGSRVQRLRLADRKVEEIANLIKVVRTADSAHSAYWLGIAPDDSPLVSRDTSTRAFYALEMNWP